MTEPSRSKAPATLDRGDQDETENSRKSWSLPSSIDVLAGAGAAATSTLIGGHLGVAGTVIGAAVASIVTTIALSLYKNVFGAGRQVIGKAKDVAQRNLVTTIAATGARPDVQQQLDQTMFLERVDPGTGNRSGATTEGGASTPGRHTRPTGRTFSMQRVVVSVVVTALLALVAGLAIVLGLQGVTGTSANEGNAGLQQQVEKAVPGSRAQPAEPSEPATGTAASSASATPSASAKASSTSKASSTATSTGSATATTTQTSTATASAPPAEPTQTATAPAAQPTAPVASRIAPTHTSQPTAAVT